MSHTQHDCNMDNTHTMVCSSSSEFKVDDCESKVRVDITAAEFATVRLWGQVKDCKGYPVPGVLLMLVKVEHDECGKCCYHGLAHTISDNEGFYQFDLCAKCLDSCYKILANKSAKGLEQFILSEDASICDKDDDCCCDCDCCRKDDCRRDCDCCRKDDRPRDCDCCRKDDRPRDCDCCREDDCSRDCDCCRKDDCPRDCDCCRKDDCPRDCDCCRDDECHHEKDWHRMEKRWRRRDCFEEDDD